MPALNHYKIQESKNITEHENLRDQRTHCCQPVVQHWSLVMIRLLIHFGNETEETFPKEGLRSAGNHA